MGPRLRPGSPGAPLAGPGGHAPVIVLGELDRARHAIEQRPGAQQRAVDLLTGTDLTRLGICPPEHGGCGWLFLDRSRNGSRRWCAMDGCGAHIKARRLTARRRVSRRASGKPLKASSPSQSEDE